MKKVITILAACMLVLTFAGIGSAADPMAALTCETDPGYINRGAETAPEQGSCVTSPFDYEDYGKCTEGMDSYCAAGGKGDIHRGLFKICDCIPDIFSDVVENETFDVGMTILVDKKDGKGPVEGNNGVYWAQDVNGTGIGMQTFSSEGSACDWDGCSPVNKFKGAFEYVLANGTTTSALPYTGTDCDVPLDREIVEFRAVTDQAIGTHGYTITKNDSISNNSVWWIDIPYMRIDSGLAVEGADVFVEVCLYESLNFGGVCGECEGCCFMLKIGTIGCQSADPEACADTLIFPYLGKTNGAWWNGIAVTNLSSEAGTASVTLYENGDVFTGSIDVAANSATIVDVTGLALTTAGGNGILGDERSYVKVVTDGFSASGFAMMAKESNGVSMGYLAEKCGNCGGCY